jgi:hypothetical protein
MSEPQVNVTPEHLEPRNAVLAEFEEATVESLTASLGRDGVEPGRLHFLVGPDGFDAYEARASRFARFFDDNDAEIAGALRNGMLVVSVHCDDEAEAQRVRELLVSLGAVRTHHFGAWTFD